MMNKGNSTVRFLLSLLLVVAYLGDLTMLHAQTGDGRHAEATWQVFYWSNDQLAGEPMVVGQDANINHDWGYGGPGIPIPADHFSGRWLRYIDVAPGLYRFTVRSDDGVRVWLDGELLVDEWADHSEHTYTVYKHVPSGHHQVKVEYYENTGIAVLHVGWERVGEDGPINQWRGEYFNNQSLAGPPVLIRNDQSIDFAWRFASPDPRMIEVDGFSARWTRNLELAAGTYRFSVTADDGVRLWVNGHLLIDGWKDQSARTYSDVLYLPGGQSRVQMEYYENTGQATAKLSWRADKPASLATYTNLVYALLFQYPGHWRPAGGYGDPANEKYVGDDGFFIVGGAGNPGSGIEAMVRSEMNHVLQPYGTYPTVESLIVDGQPARLILPSADQPSGMNGQCALIVTLPEPAKVGNHQVPYLLLYTNVDYARMIAESTVFTNARPVPGGATVLVDDTDSGFVRGGTASGWGQAGVGYNNHIYWTQNNRRASAGYNWGRWYPNLSPGRYEVYVYIPSTHASTRQARYWVSHVDGHTLKLINQSLYWDQWVSLGTYSFAGTDRDYLSLADVTYEPYLARDLAWDAVKWVAP